MIYLWGHPPNMDNSLKLLTKTIVKSIYVLHSSSNYFKSFNFGILSIKHGKLNSISLLYGCKILNFYILP